MEIFNYSETDFEFILKFVHWRRLCESKNITESFAERNLCYLNWSSLCTNSNFSEDFYERHVDMVDWVNLMRNYNISEDFYKRHFDKIRPDECYHLSWHHPFSDEFREKLRLKSDCTIRSQSEESEKNCYDVLER